MAEAAKDQDQSMEDILQSIKRIIAEEGDPVPQAGSDVLELTELLAEDGSLTHSEKDEVIPSIGTLSIDEIMAAPLNPAPPTATLPPEPMPAPVAMPEPPKVFEPEESLISEVTREASVAALDALKHAPATVAAPVMSSIGFRSGTTVEDLVLEALKPMLKDWLDTNLTGIVERLVEKEVRRLGGR